MGLRSDRFPNGLRLRRQSIMLFSKNSALTKAVKDLIKPGSQIAIGGQNNLRNPMAISSEIMAQRIDGLSLVACNLSLAGDVLVAAGLVSKISCGTINLEVYGIPWATKYAIEEDLLCFSEHDHCSILARLTASRLGLPFIPLPDVGENDWVSALLTNFPEEFARLEDRTLGQSNAVVATPLRPDVCILHVPAADSEGNLYSLGPRCFDEELVFASKSALATCEVIASRDQCLKKYGWPIIQSTFVDEIVEVKNGAYPSCVPGFYVESGQAIQQYNTAARNGAMLEERMALIRAHEI